MYFHSIKIKDYKCFQKTLNGFERLLQINIIIGKNNAGKSSLIDIIENICKRNSNFQNIFSDVTFSYSEVEKILTNYSSSFLNNKKGIKEYYENHIEKRKFRYVLKYNSNNPVFILINQEDINPKIPIEHGIDFTSIINIQHIDIPLSTKFRRLNAERNISPESTHNVISINSNGEGTTNTIQQFYNRIDLQLKKAITSNFLQVLNSILNPEIAFIDISTQVTEVNGIWEICFEDNYGNNIPLSQMGSGIKTIILTLANLILIPIIEKSEVSKYVFAFEELENNLHPSLQRKLYHFLREFVLKEKCMLFITTHSNIGIDIFYNCNEAQLISISNENGISSCKTIIQNDHINDVLNHLGFKASDLLQTNGIIWVEGPSDRVYIKKWIQLFNSNLVEGVHYSIMFYGGRLLSNVSFKDDNFDELISLIKINRNAYVVIDKDAKRITDKLNCTKNRIQMEIGDNKCWITRGREIENYLTASSIKKWLNSKEIEFDDTLPLDKYEKLELIVPNISPSYNSNKTGYAKEIINFIENNDLENMDLEEKVSTIIELIKEWN